MMLVWFYIYIFELLFFVTPLWYLRKYVSPLLTIGVIVSSLLFILATTSPYFIFVILPLGLFRVINLLRVIKARMHPDYLRKVTRRTAYFLALFHVIGVCVLILSLLISVNAALYSFLMTMFVFCLAVCATTLKNINKLKFKMPDSFLSNKNLPTITVAIPARNETADLEECLRTILANNYPKLEVLVLDDCSQGSRTADIIKSFAHEGVRFIQGDPPEDRWLAKNHAYEKLFNESNGEYIIFCGVDVRLGASSIRAMVNLLKSRNKKMLCVLPLRVAGDAETTLFQPMRYWWELALPRRLFNRPAVLSTTWMIERKVLKNLGGFSAVAHAIIPEGYFARELVKSDDYSFVRSSDELDVRTVKNIKAQKQTALRTMYPKARRRPENVLLITLAELLVFVAPVVVLVLSIFMSSTIGLTISLLSLIAVLITHLAILQISNPANMATSVLTFPLAVFAEFAAGYASMYSYEFGTVEWKDRNICIPVMHVIPKLPNIKS